MTALRVIASAPARWWGRLLCRLGRHAWKTNTIQTPGVATVIPSCTRCPEVDVDGIKQISWNRSERRRMRKRAPRSLRQLAR